MKKILVILIALIGFGFSANAQVSFRSTQKVCHKLAATTFEFYSDGTFRQSNYYTGQLVVSGTYSLHSNNTRLTTRHNWGRGTNTVETVYETTVNGGRLEKMFEYNTTGHIFTPGRCE